MPTVQSLVQSLRCQRELRYLVGQGAEIIGGLRRQMDDEQFEQAMRQALDFWD